MRIKIEKPIMNCMTIIDVLKIIDELLIKIYRLRREIQRRDYFSSEDFSKEQLLIEKYDYPIFINNQYCQLNDCTVETLESLREHLKFAYEVRRLTYLDETEMYRFGGF
jgi:hypothetical protein